MQFLEIHEIIRLVCNKIVREQEHAGSRSKENTSIQTTQRMNLVLPDYNGQTCSKCGAQKLSTEFAQPQTLSSPSLICLQCLSEDAHLSSADKEMVAEQLEGVTQQNAWKITPHQNTNGETKGSGTVTVVAFTGPKTCCEFDPSWTVLEFKNSVANATKVKANQQKLMYGQQTLINTELLSIYGITEGSTVTLIVGLFGNMGSAKKVCFAVDLSGSMGSGVGGGHTRLSVVQQHLCLALDSLNSPGCEFGIATFTSRALLPIGNVLIPSSNQSVAAAKTIIKSFRASGNNGGEAACLQHLLAMKPDLVFFLGDGGWIAEPLVRASYQAVHEGIQINSIAFYTTGGGLEEIADKTNGSHRIVSSLEDYHL